MGEGHLPSTTSVIDNSKESLPGEGVRVGVRDPKTLFNT